MGTIVRPGQLGMAFALGAAAALAGACGCEAGEPGPEAAGGAEADAGATGDPAIVPLDGNWVSDVLGFRLEGGTLTRLSFHGFGCKGELNPAGVHVCQSLLEGDLEMAEVLEHKSTIDLWTIFGLGLTAHFVANDRATATYSYLAENGCCSSSGSLELVHESLLPPKEPEHCGADITGNEVLEVGLTAPPKSAEYSPLEDGGTVEVRLGFEGQLFVIAALRAGSFSMGGITAELRLEVPETGVTGESAPQAMPFEPTADGDWLWKPIWIELRQAGDYYDWVGPQDAHLIQGKQAVLEARVSNRCGFVKITRLTGVLQLDLP